MFGDDRPSRRRTGVGTRSNRGGMCQPRGYPPLRFEGYHRVGWWSWIWGDVHRGLLGVEAGQRPLLGTLVPHLNHALHQVRTVRAGLLVDGFKAL